MLDTTAISQHSGIPVSVLEAIRSADQRLALRVVQYGSRARGTHRPRSDIGLAFFGSAQAFPASRRPWRSFPRSGKSIACMSRLTPRQPLPTLAKDGITLMDASSKKAAQLTSATGRLREAVEEYRQPWQQNRA